MSYADVTCIHAFVWGSTPNNFLAASVKAQPETSSELTTHIECITSSMQRYPREWRVDELRVSLGVVFALASHFVFDRIFAQYILHFLYCTSGFGTMSKLSLALDHLSHALCMKIVVPRR